MLRDRLSCPFLVPGCSGASLCCDVCLCVVFEQGPLHGVGGFTISEDQAIRDPERALPEFDVDCTHVVKHCLTPLACPSSSVLGAPILRFNFRSVSGPCSHARRATQGGVRGSRGGRRSADRSAIQQRIAAISYLAISSSVWRPIIAPSRNQRAIVSRYYERQCPPPGRVCSVRLC